VNLSWGGQAPGPPTPGPYTVCGTPPSGAPGPACTANDEVFKQNLLPAPAYNGPYKVNATAKASDQLSGTADTKTSNEIDFNIAAPPPNVTGVTASYDSKSHVITVSWDRDATTPDLAAYFIWRKGPGDKDFTAIEQSLQQKSGARISAPDPYASKAGNYVYEVEARRNGGDGMYSPNSDYVASDRTQSQSNQVAFTPAPGQTAPPTTAPATGGGAPPIVTGTPSGPSKSSSFSGSSSSGGSSSFSTTPTSEAVTPDPGFVRGLPYAGSNASDQNGEGDNSAIAVTPGRHSTTSGGKGYLVPVAGAAVLVLGAVHMRIFKKRLDEPPSNLTPIA
ncbi:MAG: hypothetical protein JO148_10205, partial [Acidimicrobiia bacterium]|nr:hypothetical protein [Acidimicrobiia bacterium]